MMKSYDWMCLMKFVHKNELKRQDKSTQACFGVPTRASEKSSLCFLFGEKVDLAIQICKLNTKSVNYCTGGAMI